MMNIGKLNIRRGNNGQDVIYRWGLRVVLCSMSNGVILFMLGRAFWLSWRGGRIHFNNTLDKVNVI